MASGLQFRCRQQTYLFHFKIGFTLLCLFFFILFCVLGMWQLQRYQFKKDLLRVYQERLQGKSVLDLNRWNWMPAFAGMTLAKVSAPVDSSTGITRDKSISSHDTTTNKEISFLLKTAKNLQFQTIRATGHYDNSLTMLVQNQIHNGQMGFEVLTPLQLHGEKRLLLIDRGWVAKNNIANLTASKTTTTLQGYIKFQNESQFILGKNILEPDKFPLVMQKIDISEISQITHHEFFPFIVRLNATEPNGFTRDWIISTVMPERHLGYTVQWFLMAFVLLIAYLCFSCERVKS